MAWIEIFKSLNKNKYINTFSRQLVIQKIIKMYGLDWNFLKFEQK